MSDIPSFPYQILWEERELLSVANLTRQDGIDFLRVALKIGIVAKPRAIRSTKPTRPSPISAPAASTAPRFSFRKCHSISEHVMADPLPLALPGGRFVFPIIHWTTRALHRRFCRLVQIEGRIDQRDMG